MLFAPGRSKLRTMKYTNITIRLCDSDSVIRQ